MTASVATQFAIAIPIALGLHRFLRNERTYVYWRTWLGAAWRGAYARRLVPEVLGAWAGLGAGHGLGKANGVVAGVFWILLGLGVVSGSSHAADALDPPIVSQLLGLLSLFRHRTERFLEETANDRIYTTVRDMPAQWVMKNLFVLLPRRKTSCSAEQWDRYIGLLAAARKARDQQEAGEAEGLYRALLAMLVVDLREPKNGVEIAP